MRSTRPDQPRWIRAGGPSQTVAVICRHTVWTRPPEPVILAAPRSCARPSRAVPPGSVAELSCQKIIFDLQLADLPVQKIDLRFIGGSLRRHAALEDAHRTIQQLLLPVVDLVRVDPEMHRQLGDGPVALDCRQRHLRLERRTVLLPCPLHIPAPALSSFLGAGLHLSYL